MLSSTAKQIQPQQKLLKQLASLGHEIGFAALSIGTFYCAIPSCSTYVCCMQYTKSWYVTFVSALQILTRLHCEKSCVLTLKNSYFQCHVK